MNMSSHHHIVMLGTPVQTSLRLNHIINIAKQTSKNVRFVFQSLQVKVTNN